MEVDAPQVGRPVPVSERGALGNGPTGVPIGDPLEHRQAEDDSLTSRALSPVEEATTKKTILKVKYRIKRRVPEGDVRAAAERASRTASPSAAPPRLLEPVFQFFFVCFSLSGVREKDYLPGGTIK